MFLRIYFYKLKQAIKTKDYIVWCTIFPFVLGTLFCLAFSSIYDSDQVSEIPVALSAQGEEGETVAEYMEDVLDDIEYDNGNKLFAVTKTDKEEGEKLLKKEKCDGVIIVNSFEDIKLSIRDNGVNESIITDVVNAFRNKLDIKEFVKTKGFTAGNKDPYIQYIYNLIAMICIMSSSAVMSNVVGANANMSSIGIRIDSSPVNKTIYELAQAAAVYTMQIIIMVLSLIYYSVILDMDFGANMGIVTLTGAVATFLGCSLGFAVGSIGNMKENVKNAILLWITVGGGFLSGLMVGQMRIIIEDKFPIINRINPSAVITDAFYSINVYGVSDRYYRAMIYMGGLGIVFTLIGVILSRRSSYASI